MSFFSPYIYIYTVYYKLSRPYITYITFFFCQNVPHPCVKKPDGPSPSCRWPSCEVSAMSTSILAQSHSRVCDRTYGHAGNGSAPITDVILTINMNMLLSCLGTKSIRVLFLPVGRRAWRFRLRQQVLFCFSDTDRAQQSCGS